jgi:hypothetical protein
MIFDENNYPRDSGATDMMDSCRLAGLLAIINHKHQIDMAKYTVKVDNQYLGVRHPNEIPSNNPKNFTRDQTIPLFAGIYAQNGISSLAKKLFQGIKERKWRAQNTEADYAGTTKKFPNGPDFFNPAHMLMMSVAAGEATFFRKLIGYPFVVLDILFNAIFTPTRESNQLICGLYLLGPSWLKFYKLVTPKWKIALTQYWGGWRGESQLAEEIIEWLEKI